MTRSMVVELWSRTAGVVGIYRVSQRRTFVDLCVGRWRIEAVEVAEGDGSEEVKATVALMIGHGLSEMNGWLCRIL